MNRQLLGVLACPVCKHHPLTMEVTEEDASDIIEGELCCPRCNIDYPIVGGIPDLIPPQNGRKSCESRSMPSG
jgi:uncharacterized protein YbaR (Trm112 family)